MVVNTTGRCRIHGNAHPKRPTLAMPIHAVPQRNSASWSKRLKGSAAYARGRGRLACPIVSFYR